MGRVEEMGLLPEQAQIPTIANDQTGLEANPPWSTLYINAALQQLEQILGRYIFSLPEAVSRGELRPLRNAFDAFEEIT